MLSVEKLAQSGSNRIYFRVITGTESCIATYNNNLKENNTFINFSRHFRSCGCPVPEIYAVNEDESIRKNVKNILSAVIQERDELK